MIGTYGLDKTGTRIVDNPNPDYGRFVGGDLHDSVQHNAARSRDIFHSFKRLSDRIVFRNASWPCLNEGIVVSKIHVEYWRPGNERLITMQPER